MGGQFDFAGGEGRVGRALRALADGARRLEDKLRSCLAGEGMGVRVLVRVDHNLGNAEAIAQVQENQSAVVPAHIDPACQNHCLIAVGEAQLSAGVCLVHGEFSGCMGLLDMKPGIIEKDSGLGPIRVGFRSTSR